MKRIAIFPGSFDPFTIGHDNILCRALKIFDEVVIGVGINGSKQSMQTPEERIAKIRELYADEPRVSVEAYNDLTTDFARRKGATFVVRGVRTTKDYEYEMNIADINRQLTGIETVILFAEPAVAGISSSIVRELIRFNKDVTQFIPQKNKQHK
ncbi:MAG: pantetheine-phosphate adenylyltransferase [Paludibacteraceae bacterium]|nr:pantetheine-phosphate adenylyltransferase [Paludibacteraceae bacterium]MBR6286258.1 pantetheine-phosphate adenylyltransferase [Bacteroidaceae bacterium]